MKKGNLIGDGEKERMNLGERGRENMDVEDRNENEEENGNKEDGIFGINEIIWRIF